MSYNYDTNINKNKTIRNVSLSLLLLMAIALGIHFICFIVAGVAIFVYGYKEGEIPQWLMIFAKVVWGAIAAISLSVSGLSAYVVDVQRKNKELTPLYLTTYIGI